MSAMSVPLFDLHEQHHELREELDSAISRVVASGQAILGPEVAAFEDEAAHYCGVGHAVGCASGTDALSLALQTLGVGPDDEVIMPAFTFFATAGAVCRLGARPVFADIDAATYNLDPLQVENKITPKTKAILVVHLFGQCAEMEPLWHVAERHNLPIIEDAAQAFGAEYQGNRTGTLGAIACFSFYPTKVLGAYGDAGMVATNDPEWAARLSCLRVHGMEDRYHHKYIGWNARLDALQAAVLRVKLPHVERWILARQAIAERYNMLIEDHHLGHFLARPVVRPQRNVSSPSPLGGEGLGVRGTRSEQPAGQAPGVRANRHVFNQYVVRVAQGQRDVLIRHLKSDRIGSEVYYPIPLHLQECLRFLDYSPGDFPASEDACRHVLALPMYPELTLDQQARVIQSCSAFLRKGVHKAA
jgi:dTDP-4-amino-4,6-dideoxygalactose transaminase